MPFTMRLTPTQRAFVERKAAEESRTASAWLQWLIDREIKMESRTVATSRKLLAK